MTRTGPSRRADDAEAQGRLRQAQDYLRAAEELIAPLEAEANANPAISLLILAAIGFSDALTARLIGQINKGDHAALPQQLSKALGNRFPNEQKTRLKRLIGEKDGVQYGVRLKRKPEAVKLLANLRKFGAWAEAELARLP